MVAIRWVSNGRIARAMFMSNAASPQAARRARGGPSRSPDAFRTAAPRRRRRLPIAAAALLLATVGQALWAVSAEAAATRVLGLRMFDADDHTRVVLDLSAPVRYNLFSLRKPDRAVIDLEDVDFRAALDSAFRENRRIARIRESARTGLHRIVFDLKRPSRVHSFLLAPHGRRGHRLVIDFARTAQALAGRSGGRVSPVAPRTRPKPLPRLRDVVVAVDAGHGGRDPGAIGRRAGTREKDVTLAIARKLAAELRRRPGIRPVLVRDGDYYLPLRRRTEIAARHGADLFVSIHADAFRDPKVHGASVYVLSRNGASSEAARWLAERENAADRSAARLELGGHEAMVRTALVDMSQTGADRLSTTAAEGLLASLKRRQVPVHGRHVHRAGFAVLKARNIPAVLVETAFLSNASDEKRLRTSGYQRKIARALADGIEVYFKRQAPVGTRLASRRLASR